MQALKNLSHPAGTLAISAIKKHCVLQYVLLIFALSVFAAKESFADNILRHRFVIETAKGEEVVFKVEWARNDQERRQGLMHRPHLAENHGMLFDFGDSYPVAMWMKNTLISLDMLFIDKQGTIIFIAKRTEPGSLAHISSPIPVRYVLEIAGGVSEKKQIRPGSRVLSGFPEPSR